MCGQETFLETDSTFTHVYRSLSKSLNNLPLGDFRRHEAVRFADFGRYGEISKVILNVNDILREIKESENLESRWVKTTMFNDIFKL